MNSIRQKIVSNEVWLTLLLGTMIGLDPLSIDMYLPSFASIEKAFAVNAAAVELSLSAFFVGLAVGQLIYGPLADRYGRRWPLLGGISIYFLSTIVCAFSTRIEMLVAFRFLQAVGGCAGMVITRAIVRDLFEPQKAARMFSALMLVMGAAPILAPLAGGYIDKFFGWRAIFGTLAGCSLLALLNTYFFLPETNRSDAVSARVPFWPAARAILSDRQFMGFAISGGAIQGGLFAYVAGSSYVFIQIYGVAPERFGWIFGMNSVGLIAASQLNGYLLRKYSAVSILRIVTGLAGIFATGVLVLPLIFPSFLSLLVPLFFCVGTLGFIFPNAAACALANHGDRAGTASAWLGTIQWSMAFLSSFLVSFFHNGTQLPMTSVIFGGALLAVLSFRILVDYRPGALARA